MPATGGVVLMLMMIEGSSILERDVYSFIGSRRYMIIMERWPLEPLFEEEDSSVHWGRVFFGEGI